MKNLFFLSAFCFLFAQVTSQVPEAFNYQVIPRNASDGIYPNQLMDLRISIISDSPAGSVVYTETFTATTSSIGLINLQIGKGTPVTGTFSSINWNTGIYYIKVEIDIDGGTDYIEMGIAQLISVPYAMYAKEASNVFSGNYNDLADKPDLSQYLEPDDINGLPQSYTVKLLQEDEDFLDFGAAGGFTYNSDWTLIEKVKIPVGNTSGWHIFRGKGWADQTGDFAIGLHTGGMQFWLGSGGWKYASKDTTLVTDKWYTITLTYDMSEGILSGYIGSKKVAQVAAAPADDRSNTNKLFLGGQDVSPSYAVGDLYSEQSIEYAKLDLFRRLLSTDEIASYGTQPLYDNSELVFRMVVGVNGAINIVNETAAICGNDPEFIANEYAAFSGSYTDLVNKPEQLNLTAGSGINISGSHPDLTISAPSPAGLVPVGGMVAWLKDLSGTPALPTNFAECNGQTISDPESPFNGVTLPDLNGKFLVGSTLSGTEGGASTHSHTGTTVPGSSSMSTFTGTGSVASAISHTHNYTTSTESNLPPYFSVVWIIRIK